MGMVERTTNKTVSDQDSTFFYVSSAIAGNYYPLSGTPGAIRIKEQHTKAPSDAPSVGALALLTDTAHGASSLQRGWVEVMLGRRCNEDAKVSVNDIDEVTARNWLLPAADGESASKAHRMLAVQLSTPLIPLLQYLDLTRVHAPREHWHVPANVHLLSLDRVSLETTNSSKIGRVILRVQHIFQEGEISGDLGSKVSMSLRKLLFSAGVHVSEAVELPLNGVGVGEEEPVRTVSDPITLDPLQIRTFEVTLKPVDNHTSFVWL